VKGWTSRTEGDSQKGLYDLIGRTYSYGPSAVSRQCRIASMKLRRIGQCNNSTHPNDVQATGCLHYGALFGVRSTPFTG
jgi:hypothetical protein